MASSSIFIRLAQDENVPSLVIAAWRTLLASAILVPLALLRRRTELRGLQRRDWLLAALSGFMLGLHFATWISSLAYTTITSSTVLVATVPLWVGLASPFVLDEPLTSAVKTGILIAMFGAIVIGVADLVNWEGTGALLANSAEASRPLLGNTLALIGGITSAAYLLIGRKLRQGLSLLSYTAVVYGMAALTLLTFALANGENMFGYPPQVFALFLAMALIPQMVGHSSLNWALSFLPAAFVSVAVISEPIGASVLGMVFFQEYPGPIVLLGSILILIGVLMTSRGQG